MPKKSLKKQKPKMSNPIIFVIVGLLLILTSPLIRPAVEAIFRAICSQVICGLDVLNNLAWIIPLPYIWFVVGLIILAYGLRDRLVKKNR